MAFTIPFKRNDVIRNRIKTYPRTSFFTYDRKVYLNNTPPISGAHVANVCGVDTGYLSLYEENVDRRASQYIYPFITKDGTVSAFKTISSSDYHSEFGYGDVITGSYPLSATVTRYYYAQGSTRAKVDALQNVMNSYSNRSVHYRYGDQATQEMSLIEIPSIFYGSEIRPGSISCKFYVSGSLFAELQDIRKNGELVQVKGGLGTGSVAGVVLYREGFLVITGAWSLSNGSHVEPYVPGDPAVDPAWIYFASTGSTGALENLPSSSFDLSFEGVGYVNTLTMFCHARQGELNFSQNPTWMNYGQALTAAFSGSTEYVEFQNKTIKNVVKMPWSSPTGSFQKVTFISRVNIHDEDGNIIAFAKLATPSKKIEERSLTFKLKIDL